MLCYTGGMSAITLTRTQRDATGAHSYPLEVTASSTTLDPAVFMHQLPTIVGDPPQFTGVCTVPDLQQMPSATTPPTGLMGQPFFRSRHLLLYCRTAVLREEIWAQLIAEVQDLVDQLQAGTIQPDLLVTITPSTS